MAFADLESIKIDSEADALHRRREAYLHKRGWEHTSQTVDSCWRWFKKIGGRQYGCGTLEAFKIQDCIDRAEYVKAHPEEFED